ncbi:hypothetical protein [Kitasatospora sp. SUK 42]|uniref:hypothetical protein n=1 Tax=Kitasatospora sp. SUK 42 TaxID=1588882 RepID=UPI0018CAA658|nr:hypothetical protein [Kitasatospora sp. SUK 42]MBV2153469.1 hypothetical protein [Kitasatospora sp. SUK 42]
MRVDHEIRVEIPGVRPPITRTLTSEALEAIWDSICFRPMPRLQHQLLERVLTGPCAERDVIRHLAANPFLALPFGHCELRISWANSGEESA